MGSLTLIVSNRRKGFQIGISNQSCGIINLAIEKEGMKVVLLSYFTPFVALPLAYLPFKYLEKTAIPDVKLRLGNALEQEDFRLQKVEWINWIENLTAPSEGSAHDGIDGTSGERKRNSNVDFQALISFFASYLFFKFFCKISRVIVLTTLISVAL